MKKKTHDARETAHFPVLWESVIMTVEKEGGSAEFSTRVEDIKRNSIVVETPIRQTGNAVLVKGDKVEVCYSRKDAAYTFKASILDLFEGEHNAVELKTDGPVERKQRRRFVRLDISGAIRFRILDRPGRAEAVVGGELPGTLLNISAGGVLFETESEVVEDSILILSFSLKGKEGLENILAVVKRVDSDDGFYLVGAEFVTADNSADLGLESLKNLLPPGTGTFDDNLQKLILQFIYSQQVEFRMKGMLT